MLKLRLSREALLEEGTPNEVSAAKAAELRELRIAAARKQAHWNEIEETTLVRHGPWLVHADSDAIYKIHRGIVWGSGSASVVAEFISLAWFVDRDGQVVFLERMPATWSEIVAKRARRRRGATA